ncbi:hypothetical protein [Hymenobacter terrigena]
MKKPAFSNKEIKLEHEIGYSQSAILFDILIGLALLLGGSALAYWLWSWVALLWPLFGLFLVWQAVKRAFQQGPQFKIGARGIWTVKTGFLSWSRVQLITKTEASYRSVSRDLVIVNRIYSNQGLEIARISARELDVDWNTLQMYANKYSPKQL